LCCGLIGLPSSLGKDPASGTSGLNHQDSGLVCGERDDAGHEAFAFGTITYTRRSGQQECPILPCHPGTIEKTMSDADWFRMPERTLTLVFAPDTGLHGPILCHCKGRVLIRLGDLFDWLPVKP
jgi:hypothetical protein